MGEGAEANSEPVPDHVLRLAQPLLCWETKARLSPSLGLQVQLRNMVKTERDDSKQVSDSMPSTHSALGKWSGCIQVRQLRPKEVL